MKLWLDDDPRRDAWMIPDGGEGWTVVRTVDAAISAVEAAETWEAASLDNDLGFGAPGGDGVNFVKWMIENAEWPEQRPNVHSFNPVAARRMTQDIDHYGPYS